MSRVLCQSFRWLWQTRGCHSLRLSDLSAKQDNAHSHESKVTLAMTPATCDGSIAKNRDQRGGEIEGEAMTQVFCEGILRTENSEELGCGNTQRKNKNHPNPKGNRDSQPNHMFPRGSGALVSVALAAWHLFSVWTR